LGSLIIGINMVGCRVYVMTDYECF
jgi:hypothetical protein